jgi:hypothetical protein
MNSWGYIWIGLGCAVVAGILIAVAQPSQADAALAIASGEVLHAHKGVLLLGYLFALPATILTPIGIVAQGVKVGRES